MLIRSLVSTSFEKSEWQSKIQLFGKVSTVEICRIRERSCFPGSRVPLTVNSPLGSLGRSLGAWVYNNGFYGFTFTAWGSASNCGACYRNRQRGFRRARIGRGRGRTSEEGPINCSFYANDTRNVPLKARRIDSACPPDVCSLHAHAQRISGDEILFHGGHPVPSNRNSVASSGF